MAEDANEQTEAEEIGEGIDLEAEGAAPRRKRCGFWTVVTLIFVVATAALAWLYSEQLDELAALRSQTNQANSQVVRLQQANRQVSAELAKLMDKLQEVVKAVNELQEVEGVQPAEAKPADVATKALKSQPAEEAKAAEEAKPAEQQRPGPRVPRVPPRR